MKRRNYKRKYLYIIRSIIFGRCHYKIGVTKRIEGRVATISGYCPYPIKLVFSRQINDAHKVEGIIHLMLHKFNTSGEWFLCSLKTIIQAVNKGPRALQARLRCIYRLHGWKKNLKKARERMQRRRDTR